MDASLRGISNTREDAKMIKSDSLIGKLLTEVLNQMILNFLFLLCCAGIVTIPASLSAMYAVQFKIHADEDPNIFACFFAELKKSFLRALCAFLVSAAAAAPAILIWIGCAVLDWQLPRFIHLMLAFTELCVFAVSCWIYPLIARYENTLKGTLQSAFALCFSFFPTTVLLIAIPLFFVVLFAVMPYPLIRTYTCFMIFFSCAVSARLAVIPISKVFTKVTGEEVSHESKS